MNFEKKEDKEATLILIVDDQIENIQLLGQFLRLGGYRIAIANNGNEALDFVDKIIPDLILLDIMMPQMDGFEVCQKIKSNPRTSDIPIIFLTAKNLTDDVVRGFRLGGIDYVTKPFNPEELLIRIKTHIDLKQSQDLIIRQNDKLKKLNDNKNAFLSIAAHDLKNPVNVILGFSKLIIDNYLSMNDDEILEFIEDIKSASNNMKAIINDMIDINAIDENKIIYRFEKFDLCIVINEVIADLNSKANRKSIKIIFDNSQEKIVNADKERTRQIIENLMSNALKFSPINRKITIICTDISENNFRKCIRFEIKDEGPGIKEEEFHLLFTRMAKISSRPGKNESKTGLGLAISKALTEGMSGKIWCESTFGHGSSFFLELPNEDFTD